MPSARMSPRRPAISAIAAIAAVLGFAGLIAGVAGLTSDDDAAPNPGRSAAAQEPSTTPEATNTPGPLRLVLPHTAKDGPPPTQTPTPTPEPTATPTPVPQPQGIRVWSNGDSTSYFMSAAFLSMMSAAGAIQVQPYPEYKISSGLSSPGFFNWPAYLASEMAAYDPHIVVFMVGANDAYTNPETYRVLVAEVMDQLAGRTVAWVGQPNMGRADLAATLPGLNAVMAEEAAKRDWVIYVDTWWLTSDANGNYTAYAADGTLMRAADGVHFTTAGGYILASAVMAALGY